MSAARRLRRWGIFNLVGLLGFALQLGLLFLLRHFAGMNYLIATGIAVEATVLHNFVWHERVTWADVTAIERSQVWSRLLKFHLANGLISIAGNLALTWMLVEEARLPYLLANAISVVICSLVNFVAGDAFVFREHIIEHGGHGGRRGKTALLR
jgi:Predicted membrane protein